MNELGHLADTIRCSQEGGAWHGPSLSAILEVTAEQAATRIGNAHTIRELTEHIIAWLDIVLRRSEREPLTDDNLSWEDNCGACCRLESKALAAGSGYRA
jgi:hypothetical protein